MAAAINPVGSKSEKPWRDAIRRAVNRREEGKRSPKWLDRLADQLVLTGNKGDVSALKEIGDRLDGKPVQGVEMALNVQVTEIKYTIVHPGDVIEGECEEVEPEPVKTLEQS